MDTSVLTGINSGKKVTTRIGNEVRVYDTSAGKHWPIHGAWRYTSKDNWKIAAWRADGTFRQSGAECDQDLILVKE